MNTWNCNLRAKTNEGLALGLIDLFSANYKTDIGGADEDEHSDSLGLVLSDSY